MFFDQRIFTIAKDAAKPQENQDAAACDSARGIAAMADGASSSLQSGRWARLLVDGVVSNPPDIADATALGRWLSACRNAWREGIDEAALAWHQKARLADGAFSTLVWLRLGPLGDGALSLRAFAIGDSCLLHVRGGSVLRSFPIEDSQQFGTEPTLLGSASQQAANTLAFDTLDDSCQPGDWLILATDAVAAWALVQLEKHRPLGLESLWDMTQDDFDRWIGRLRSEQQIRYDDSTVMLVRLRTPKPSCAPEDAHHEKAADQLGQLGRWARQVWKSAAGDSD